MATLKRVYLGEKHWIALAVRSIEKSAPLDDEQEMVAAFRTKTDLESRILERAQLLGQRLGFQVIIDSWRQSAAGYIFFTSLFLLAVIGGLHFTQLIITTTINPVLSLFSILTVPTVMLTIWTLSLLRNGLLPNFFEWPVVLRAVCWILALTTHENRNAAHLFYGGLAYLRQSRITTWYLGLGSHAIWALALVMLIIITWFSHSVIVYDIVWQSTRQDPAAYEGFVRGMGLLPELLGFPNIDSIALNEKSVGAARVAASQWLIGCIVTYGLLPRLILFAVCWLVLHFRSITPAIDFADPYFCALATRFSAMEETPIVDAESPPAEPPAATLLRAGTSSLKKVCIGYELPEECRWPPHFAATDAKLLQSIAGTAAERRNTLNALASLQPCQLLICCDSGASPDRGTERFLQEAMQYCGALALFLESSLTHNRDNPERWANWASTLKPNGIRVLRTTVEAEKWWGGGVG